MQSSQFHSAFLQPDGYDLSLARGYNRSGNILQRPQFIIFDGQLFEPVHVRYPLPSLLFSKSMRKILRQAKAHFRIEVKRVERIGESAQWLYQQNLPRFKGTFSQTLESIVLSANPPVATNTLEFSVYDGQQLIAVSYLDQGIQCVCSIISVYDPSYARYSPGILTMLLEMEYAKEAGYQYYYPGYIFHEPTSFDYKTRFGHYEYMIRLLKWRNGPYPFNAGKLAQKITSKSWRLHLELLHLGIRNKIRFYTPQFAGGIDFANLGLCEFPIILELLDYPMRFAVWDHKRENYYVYLMRPDPLVPNPTSNMTADYAENPMYFHLFLFKQYSIDLSLFLDEPRNRMDVVKSLGVERNYHYLLEKLSELPTQKSNSKKKS
ncbi:MAG: GNAT family N-acetyltransferase [Flavobacteriales bacterium]